MADQSKSSQKSKRQHKRSRSIQSPFEESPANQSDGSKASAQRANSRWVWIGAAILVASTAVGMAWWQFNSQTPSHGFAKPTAGLNYLPRRVVDDSGYAGIIRMIKPWPANATLPEISQSFKGAAAREIERLDKLLADPKLSKLKQIETEVDKAIYFNYDGQVDQAYEALGRARNLAAADRKLAEQELFNIIFFQGVTSLRKGENENCIMCRGASSCILPIDVAAVHQNQKGSRLAIAHFLEYLDRFPDDTEVWWLLNLAHMTLGEHPSKVDPRYLVPLDHYVKNEHSMGEFRDIGAQIGVNRLNQAGGGIMDDFDNDGLLDIVVTSFDPTQVMGFYRNQGNGKFEDLTRQAGLADQLGGLYCVQADYNNDGWLDVMIVRGAWLTSELAMRPSLLKNNGDGTFSDVTEAVGLGAPINSNSAVWADYNNDGWLDVFVCCEQQANRLYRSNGDGTFTDVAAEAGVAGSDKFACKGASWFDYDNDGLTDLFVNNMSSEGARLYRNNGRGYFQDVTATTGIQGPVMGFGCWSWDFDNDGWLDIFATCYERTLNSLMMTTIGAQHPQNHGRLYRNRQGRGFEDVTREMNVAGCYATMGCNFGDLNNDGFLDFYLGTGDPNIQTLTPNRMFLNLAGQAFADISASSRTGHLQKGHAVSCGDWDRDGNVDMFVEMGGAINGDKYHNILFQNPGNQNSWVTIKLTGKKTNRQAIGARLTIKTSGPNPMTVHRVITSGSSFGANPLEQTVGLADATGIAELIVDWPASGARQVFQNVPLRKFIQITEFDESFQASDLNPIQHDLSK